MADHPGHHPKYQTGHGEQVDGFLPRGTGTGTNPQNGSDQGIVGAGLVQLFGGNTHDPVKQFTGMARHIVELGLEVFCGQGIAQAEHKCGTEGIQNLNRFQIKTDSGFCRRHNLFAAGLTSGFKPRHTGKRPLATETQNARAVIIIPELLRRIATQ